MNLLLSLFLAYPFLCLLLVGMMLFAITSYRMERPWSLRFLGNDLAFSTLTFRQRKRWQTYISIVNVIGLLLSFPAQWIHSLTHNLVHGPVKDRYYRCHSYEDAYNRAKKDGQGKEPLSHPPHNEGEMHHFHLHKHSFIQRNGFRENPHYQYRP